jgi:hypothetical protein
MVSVWPSGNIGVKHVAACLRPGEAGGDAGRQVLARLFGEEAFGAE